MNKLIPNLDFYIENGKYVFTEQYLRKRAYCCHSGCRHCPYPLNSKNMYENPWTNLDKSTVYENPWIKIEHHNVINPSGNPGIYGIVKFKNLAIGIIPIDSQGFTWIVGQYRYALQAFSWEIPEGGGPLNSDPLLSAQKELLEETGLLAQKWTKIMDVHTSNSVTDEKAMIFIAQNLSQSIAQPEETEKLYVKKIHLNDLFEMAMKGEITDALALCGIFKLKYLIDNNEILL